MPFFGLELLDMARGVADFNLPAGWGGGRVERRAVKRGLVAIPAADIVYSRLIGRDEVGMLAYKSATPRFGRSRDHGAQGLRRQHNGRQRRDK